MSIFDAVDNHEFACPNCGRKDVDYIDTCHTWRQDGRWMACLGCFSATEFYCYLDDEEEETGCGWRYVWGLNPDNPRSEANEKCRPEWLGDQEHW